MDAFGKYHLGHLGGMLSPHFGMLLDLDVYLNHAQLLHGVLDSLLTRAAWHPCHCKKSFNYASRNAPVRARLFHLFTTCELKVVHVMSATVPSFYL